ncbi:nuclear transport factor 2 family protein [Streptomyces actuosus]|uniref:Nuclear transport factor 2 family protein n=1 Tax=Streptomyces actuosus TaxID=1885 RepID=A0ABS2VP39_STRAS|nr:nuclear transport factor 2 family protein [Streptomyces actuosus]MBN0044878.1 nuclear transport factor 2 family protein [Streptomyces actuosus]
MAILTSRLSDPAVRAFVGAVNARDREGFLALLTPDATMSDDGSDRDLTDWIDREIFSTHGHLEVDNESDGGRALTARYSNDTWGEMRTRWRFTVADDGRISRFETGQA